MKFGLKIGLSFRNLQEKKKSVIRLQDTRNAQFRKIKNNENKKEKMSITEIPSLSGKFFNGRIHL